jgi:hypothetical protein
MTNINILKDMNASKRNDEKEKDDQKDDKLSSKITSSNENDSHFNFANYANFALANSTLRTSFHSLINSVIYDSKCSQSLIFDKNRFVSEEITSANDLIKISNDHIQIEKYEIMRVCKRLNDKTIEITFKKTTYISVNIVTLVSQFKLEKKEYDRDSYTKTLIQMKTSKQICEIQNRYKIQLLKFNLVFDKMTNSFQLSKNIMIKTSS